jgi:hypothetical protein
MTKHSAPNWAASLTARMLDAIFAALRRAARQTGLGMSDTPAPEGSATSTGGEPFGVCISCVAVPGVGMICASVGTGSMPSAATPAAVHVRRRCRFAVGRRGLFDVHHHTPKRRIHQAMRILVHSRRRGPRRSFVIERELTEAPENDRQELPSR